MVLESKGDRTLQIILQLLKSLCASTVITVDQLRRVWLHLLVILNYCSFKSASYQNCLLLQGFERVYLDMADISIDVPCAYSLLEQFVEQSFNAGVIDKKLRDLCPCR